MEPDDHELAEAVVKHVLVGRSIVGMYFGASNIWFGREGSGEDASLRVENRWRVGPGSNVPELDLRSHQDWRELARAAVELAGQRIIDTRVGREVPNLTLHFDEGRSLFISGANVQYESWELSFGEFMVVATPNCGIAVWTPNNWPANRS